MPICWMTKWLTESQGKFVGDWLFAVFSVLMTLEHEDIFFCLTVHISEVRTALRILHIFMQHSFSSRKLLTLWLSLIMVHTMPGNCSNRRVFVLSNRGHVFHMRTSLLVLEAFSLPWHLLCDLTCVRLTKYLVFTFFLCTHNFSLAQIASFLRTHRVFYTSLSKGSDRAQKRRGGEGRAPLVSSGSAVRTLEPPEPHGPLLFWDIRSSSLDIRTSTSRIALRLGPLWCAVWF